MTMASYKFEWMHGTITMFFSHRTSKYPSIRVFAKCRPFFFWAVGIRSENPARFFLQPDRIPTAQKKKGPTAVCWLLLCLPWIFCMKKNFRTLLLCGQHKNYRLTEADKIGGTASIRRRIRRRRRSRCQFQEWPEIAATP